MHSSESRELQTLNNLTAIVKAIIEKLKEKLTFLCCFPFMLPLRDLHVFKLFS